VHHPVSCRAPAPKRQVPDTPEDLEARARAAEAVRYRTGHACGVGLLHVLALVSVLRANYRSPTYFLSQSSPRSVASFSPCLFQEKCDSEHPAAHSCTLCMLTQAAQRQAQFESTAVGKAAKKAVIEAKKAARPEESRAAAVADDQKAKDWMS
jgi:hypothetical protein